MEVPETPPSGAASPEHRRKERHRKVPLLPEVRHWTASNLEVRSASKTDEIVITGRPIVYDTDYEVVDCFGPFTERMAPGVAAEVLARGADVRFLFDHGGLPLARSTSGTLTLADTPEALVFTARLDARQQLANDLAVAIERSDVTQMSCGFCVAAGGDEWDESMEHRTINRFSDLLDVSAVTYPASPTTSIAIAHRMALAVPVESRARLRKVYVDLRAGRPVAPERLEAFRALLTPDLDPGEDTQTPEGTGRLGNPDGNGQTWADPGDDAGDSDLPSSTPPDGTEGNDATGSNVGAPPQDGTGSRFKAPATASERRDQSMSYGDRQSAVYQALCAQYGTPNQYDYCDLWICDIGDDWVVWQDYSANSLCRISYVLGSDGAVTFAGDPQPVIKTTVYQAVPAQTSRATRLKVKRVLRGL